MIVQAEDKSEPAQQGKLLRILGVSFGISAVIGGTIGVGILRTPGMVAAQVKSGWMIVLVWALGGIFVLLATVSLAELATMLPRVGGPYVYVRRAFGDYVGFVVGWSDWITNTVALAYLAVAVGEYTATLFPVVSPGVNLIAISMLLLFTLLHWLGLRFGSRAQELTSLLKVLAFAALIIACFIFEPAQTATARQPAALRDAQTFATFFVGVMLALQSVVVTYDGWNTAVYFAEEDTNPTRNLPRSLIGGVVLVIGVYLLFNLALLHTLTVEELAGSKLPAATAALRIFGARGGTIVTVLAVLSIVSIINAQFLFTPRIMFALGRDRLFFSKVTSVNRRGTPTVAMGITAVTAILLAAAGTFETLLAITSFFLVINYAAVFASVLIMRSKAADLERPFRAWGYPITTIIVLVGSIMLLVGFVLSDRVNSLYAFAVLLLSGPAYLLAMRMNLRHSPIDA